VTKDFAFTHSRDFLCKVETSEERKEKKEKKRSAFDTLNICATLNPK
jgi:hypothetical protein